MQRLLALRQRKERRLRQQLVNLRHEYQQQEQRLADCRLERQQLCQQLRTLAQWRGKLLPEQADEQRVLQHTLYQAERQRQKQIGEEVALRRQKRAAIESQLVLLRSNQREQEKLRIMISDESYRY